MARFSQVWILIFIFCSYLALSETNEAARQFYVDQFLQFNENRNVFGEKAHSEPSAPKMRWGVSQDNDLKYSSLPYDSRNTGSIKFTPQSNQSSLEKAVGSLRSSIWIQQTSISSTGSETFREKLTPSAIAAVQTIAKESFTDLSQEMTHSLLQREASARATKALWDRTLAQLTQRKVFLASGIELSDSLPNCDEAAAASRSTLTSSAISTCESLIKEKWNTVNDIESEDPYIRDLRNQLHAIFEAGIDKSELKSNWAYDESEFRTQNGDNPLSNAGQLQAYGDSLDQATERMNQYHRDSSIEYVQAEAKLSNNPILGALTAGNNSLSGYSLDQFKIRAKEKDIVSINQPTEALVQDLGITPLRKPLPQTYSELLQQTN